MTIYLKTSKKMLWRCKMYISKKQLEQLIEVENKLGPIKKYKREAIVLMNIVESCLQQRDKDNKRTAKRINAKRATDPAYARSKKEKARIYSKATKDSKVVNYFNLESYPIRLFKTKKDTLVLVTQLHDKNFVWAEVEYCIYGKCINVLNTSPLFNSELLKELLERLSHPEYITDTDSSYCSYDIELEEELSMVCYDKDVSLNIIPLDAVDDNGVKIKDWLDHTLGICKKENGEWAWELGFELFDCNKIK